MNRGGRTFATLVAILVIVAGQELTRRALAHAFEEAPARLADTGLYEPGQPMVIAAANQPFSPQYPLWSDGAVKRRWVYLPPGAAIDAADIGAWDFPVGTRFWKEFTIDGRKVETRFLWKAAPRHWVFASYAWNEAGTDAVRAPEEGIRNVAPLGNGRAHSIPAHADCRACHDAKRTEVLGFNALQLSTDRDPNAIHGEPLAPGMTTLETLIRDNRLRPSHRELLAAPPRIHASTPQTRAVLGYLVGNCGGCHNHDGDLSALGPSLKHADVAAADGDALVQRLFAQATRWQVPGMPDGSSRLFDADAPAHSAILARMRSRRPSSQMPPVGTVVPDRAAIAAITAWLDTRAQGR